MQIVLAGVEIVRIFEYQIKQKKYMKTYTDSQINSAKEKYNAMLVMRSVSYYSPELIGYAAAEQRCDFHNKKVSAILGGDLELAKEWKMFFLNEEVKKSNKKEESKAKLSANKEASSDILAPIKLAKKIGEFGKWLNNSNNQFRKEFFTKKYTQESVSAFLSL